jgi:hypothetical protein
MLIVIVVTGIAHALHPPSNVETTDPVRLHLQGEFAESNRGTALEPDGSATVRLIAQQYSFVPNCALVPADTPVKFCLTSPDTIHGFLLGTLMAAAAVLSGRASVLYTPYIERQLGAFTEGMRHNDISEQMRAVAKELTLEEMHAVAIFYGAQGGEPTRPAAILQH